MPKAERDGIYRLNGHYFKARKGVPIPDDAEMVDDEPVEERARSKAPENKAKASTIENRAEKQAD